MSKVGKKYFLKERSIFNKVFSVNESACITQYFLKMKYTSSKLTSTKISNKHQVGRDSRSSQNFIFVFFDQTHFPKISRDFMIIYLSKACVLLPKSVLQWKYSKKSFFFVESQKQ